MSYKVYRIKHTLAMQDPDMPSPRHHNMIFVETQDDGSGMVHHVTGDITTGMQYDTRHDTKPEDSETFFAKELLGTMEAADHPQRMNRVLAALPPPPKQKHFNISTIRTEQVKPDGYFYKSAEARPPMVKYTEWTVDQAIPALYAAGIVRK